MCGESQENSECFKQSVPTYLGTHDCVLPLYSVLGMSVESAPAVGGEKEEELEEKEKEEKEEDTSNDTHSLGAEGNFVPFSGW